MIGFPAARKGDPVTHDMLVPSGVIGPPLAGPCPPPMGPVMIEMLPAAHVTCTVVCSGATSLGPVHPPPVPPAPPPPIITGSPTVFIHGMPAARWIPSGDIGLCSVFLGDPKLVATRTVFIGNGIVPTLQLRIAIVGGTAYDTPAGRERIARMLARLQEVTGMAVQVTGIVTIDNSDYRNLTSYGPWDGTHNYTGGELLEALNTHGDSNSPTMIFTDQVQGGSGPVRGSTLASPWAGTDDTITNEGVAVSNSADNETAVHEMGHLLSGQTGPNLHSTNPTNIMAGGTTGRSQWTDPWRSSALNSPYVTRP